MKLLYVKFVCVKLLYVTKLCGGRRRRRREEEAPGIQNQKQEPHTKMWGNIGKFNPPKNSTGIMQEPAGKITSTTGLGMEEKWYRNKPYFSLNGFIADRKYGRNKV